jgi:hypothetical protein
MFKLAIAVIFGLLFSYQEKLRLEPALGRISLCCGSLGLGLGPTLHQEHQKFEVSKICHENPDYTLYYDT